MRALASIGLLTEDDRRGFCLTEAGALLREDHPHSLKAMALHEEGPVLYTAWKQVALTPGGTEGVFSKVVVIIGIIR